MTGLASFRVIVRPLLTERSTIMKEKFNQYVFEAEIAATKADIRAAVEELFKVRVERVRTMTVKGKTRRYGRNTGSRPDWKKAIVTLEKGHKIDLADQTA
jgi:large subunit ribosomal protein L23